jgi:hypothetical protein
LILLSGIAHSFNDPLVKTMVDKVIKQGPSYYCAIQKSTETAQKGCSFAADAMDFCQRLRAEDALAATRARLDTIKQVAKSAHACSKEMNSLFKLVRVELFKVRSHTLPL